MFRVKVRKRVTFLKSIKIQAFITTNESFDQNIEAAVNKGKTGSIKKRDFKIICFALPSTGEAKVVVVA